MTSLVIQTAFLGDVVLTTPLLEALAARHGPVDVVTTPAAAALLETHPAVRRVIPYDKKGRDAGPGGLVRLARRLRAERYAVAYLPHRSLRTALAAWLARIPQRVGFADGWRWLYTEVRWRPRDGHEVDRVLALADFPPTNGAVTQRWGTKRWPYYEKLVGRLVDRVRVVLVGGPEDADLAEKIVRAVEGDGGRRRAVNACGRLTLRQSAEAIRRAALLVTNDSAPLHLAQAVGTPTVAIFGPTVPAFGFGPRGPRDRVVELNGLMCRPCSAHGPHVCPLGHHRCMQSLGVEDVLQAIEETGALRRRD
ncbi:MAG: hypothetical protein DMD46_12500 [Gemmatimonadetes bacterium]|nr:MAG: hypothetical protein DMD46_12500 [Gemmatimonadota bacterium]